MGRRLVYLTNGYPTMKAMACSSVRMCSASECGAQGEEVEKVVYSEADVGELIDEARNAWVNRDARHLDLFESSKSASEADHLDKYFATEESCNQ